MVTTAADKNSCVSRDSAAPPLIARRNRPPVEALTMENTTASATELSMGILYFLNMYAAWNTALEIALDLLTLPRTPFLMDSHTAGTPARIVGRNAQMSPWQLRTEASVKVLIFP